MPQPRLESSEGRGHHLLMDTLGYRRMSVNPSFWRAGELAGLCVPKKFEGLTRITLA
jgi:hypothetical protein